MVRREGEGLSFDLYFAGAKNKIADEYLMKKDANRLQSQLIDRANITEWYDKKSDKSKLFIDSGAYTAYTKGIKIDVDDYIGYLNNLSDRVTIFAQLDTIPGEFRQEKTKEDRLNAPKLSWENYLYMRERLKEPKKLIPIFHQGEDYKWLKNMLEWKDENGEHIPYIGISPAIDVPGIEDFLNTSFRIIAESSNPDVKTHAFGMTQLKMLELYPYTSADSTSWKMSAAMGSIYTPYGTIYVSDRRNHDKAYIKNQPKEAMQNILNYIERLGFTFDDIMLHDYNRYIVNIQYLLDWAENYKFKGNKRYRKSLF